MTTAGLRTLRLGSADYPVVLPNVGDPRLHLAAVIISIHVLGQTSLGFRVSVPQILVAILTCALIEVGWTFVKSKEIVWPASAMLTGSGVALILRIVGQDRGDHWTWSGWYFFAGIAAFSLLSKYLIRFRGSHVFNPSNLGLVVAFLVIGSEVIEPLDFWWSPLDPGMAAAYLIILVGGLLITRRLRLLALAAGFWLTLAAGIGVLAASGHCMTTAWALQPVCGSTFWWTIITSPEVLIFLFFMITDPKTIPAGKSARIVFGITLALACTLLMAPQTTEFGAKVALLGGLVVLTPLRYLFDRLLPGREPARSPVSLLTETLPSGGRRRVFLRGAMVGSALVALAALIVAAGAPARVAASPAAGSSSVDVDIDPSTLPEVTVSPDALALSSEVDPDELALMLAEDLAVEGEAMLSSDTSLLRAVDDGPRLIEMERKVEVAATLGNLVVDEHSFDSLHLDVVFTDGPQGGASLALVASGTVDQVGYDPNGEEQERLTTELDTTFVMRQGASGRWVIVGEESR
jgi:hypothetical protein